MTKNIIGQATYMIIIIMIILFAGEYFLPEENQIVSGYHISQNGHVITGRRFDYQGNDGAPGTYTQDMTDKIGPSRHFTILFTTFIFLQIVNEWNCRKLFNELNVFEGILSNPISIVVRITESVIQVIISEFSGRLFSCYPDGMMWYQWLICIAFSLGSFVIRFILLLVPEDGCGQVLILNYVY